MQTIQKKRKKKKNNKPLFTLAAFIVFFGIFIYLITRPSIQSKAIKELQTSFNRKDVELIWHNYKADLYHDEDFIFETRKKLSSFKLSERDIKDCQAWLPPAPTSINVIIIPDLSRRIIDTLNNAHQIDNDIIIFKNIWQSFVSFSKLKQDTKDKLIVDVTDINQAKGQFGAVADKLQFDLATHKEKSNILFFTDDKNRQFEDAIKKMYELAKKKPLGADYTFYIRRYLGTRLKKSTLFDNYINKVIIISDGYLEATGKPADTKIYGFEKILYPAVNIGNVLNIINKNQLNIPKVNIDLSNTQILICEVNERKTGKGKDFEILECYWKDWMNRMGLKDENFRFIPREQSNTITKNHIEDFITN